MSDTKHTKGPWMWDGHGLRPINPSPDESRVHTILEVENFAYGFAIHGRSREALDATMAEDAANRSLIAAAPELLEALRQITHADHSIYDDTKTAVDDLVCIARAAIAKATGGAA